MLKGFIEYCQHRKTHLKGEKDRTWYQPARLLNSLIIIIKSYQISGLVILVCPRGGIGLSVITGFQLGDDFLAHYRTLCCPEEFSAPRHKGGFDPSSVKSLLPHLFVKEIPYDDDLQVRLQGEYLVKLLGPVHQYVNVYDRFEPCPKKTHIQFIKTVLETPVAGVLHRSPDTPEGRAGL